jgi:hypothetical protein
MNLVERRHGTVTPDASASTTDTSVVLTLGRFHDPHVALGRVVSFLRDVQPFASFDFGVFAGTLVGQIERGHYFFVLRDEQVVGYFGYALCDEAVAQAWMDGRYVPTLDECRHGAVIVGMTMHTVSREVFTFLIRESRKLLPKARTVFRRHYVTGKPERLGRILNRERAS